MNKKLIKTLAAGALLAASAAGFASPVLNDFKVDPGTAPVFTADKLTGNYNEGFTVTGANTFVTKAYWDAGQFVKNDGNTPLLAKDTRLNNDYALYAVFESAGTFAPSGTGTVFTGGIGSLHLFLDTKLDTTKALGASALLPVSLGNTSDDVEIAWSISLLAGSGTEKAGTNQDNGDFKLVFGNFTLTSAGETFFTSPSPFYDKLVLAGQFNSFEVTGNQSINGSADAWFIPEPAGLALVGFALSGLGLFGRRRKS